MPPHYRHPLSSYQTLLLENVGQTVLRAARAAGHHRGDLPSHHVGERERGGGAGLRLGRQEHRAVHPQEAGGLLSKGPSYA